MKTLCRWFDSDKYRQNMYVLQNSQRNCMRPFGLLQKIHHDTAACWKTASCTFRSRSLVCYIT